MYPEFTKSFTLTVNVWIMMFLPLMTTACKTAKRKSSSLEHSTGLKLEIISEAGSSGTHQFVPHVSILALHRWKIHTYHMHARWQMEGWEPLLTTSDLRERSKTDSLEWKVFKWRPKDRPSIRHVIEGSQVRSPFILAHNSRVHGCGRQGTIPKWRPHWKGVPKEKMN